jgi:predicted ATPase/class 3 adenylate cyclase
VTFLFTDIEGSTALWDRSPRLMASALARHDALVVDAIARCGGFVFSSGGDGYGAAFSSASAAVGAAMSLQQILVSEEWPVDVMIRVRMGLHTGIAEERDNNYFGATVSRAARIADAGNGGQIILSAATAELVADDVLSLTDLGAHRLAGFGRPERLYRVVVPGIPDVSRPLRRDQDEFGNLPHHRAPLVGRDSELRALDGLLEPGTVVSVTGVGGVGKTRLALAAARAAAHRFADGAWLVELATVVAPADVPAAVASQLRLQPEADIDAAAIATILARQERLVVLDNCEHVLDAATELTDALGRHSAAVTVLATTREALGVDGEHVLAVRPLPVDGGDQISDASRLFCERASGVLGSFDPSASDLAVVDDICRRLDGLPLAIELAAARLPTMTLAELDSRLGDRFALLTRRRGVVERHQSLRTTMGWSYDLLSAPEQIVFDRLSVFAGDFDLDAAVAVVGEVTDAMPAEDILGSLVAKSLVLVIRGPSGTRYQLLETLRQYGEERLKARGETFDVRQRHLRYFLEWSSRADAGVRSASELAWHHAFAVEWHNLRNAFGWACATNDVHTVTMLLRHVAWWAAMRIRMEVADWADAALALPRPDDLPVDPVVRSSAAFFAAMRGDVDTGRAWFEAAAADAERSGVTDPRLWSLKIWVARDPDEMLAAARELQRRASISTDRFWTLLGVIQECTVNMIQAGSRAADVERTAAHTARIREVLELADESGIPNLISHTSMALGGILRHSAPDEALGHLERALELAVAGDAEASTSSARFQLAALHTTMHRPLDALAVLEPTLERHLLSGAARWVLSAAAYCIRPLLEADHAELATLVLGAVLRALDARPRTRRATVYVDQASLQQDLRARLGDAAVEQLLDDGRRRPLDDTARQLVQAISELTRRAQDSPSIDQTWRESGNPS